MKKLHWIIFIGVDLGILTAMFFLAWKFNWWILWITLMAHGLAGIIFLIYIIFKNRNVEKTDDGEVKKAKITKDDCLNLLKEELLKPIYADMIRKIDYNRTENYGSDQKTPINIIKAFGYFERGVEYYWITNMNNPESPTLILFYPMKFFREEFELKLEEIKNKVADFPENIEEVIQNPITLPSGQSGIQTIRRRMSREEKKKQEEEKAEEEAETLE